MKKKILITGSSRGIGFSTAKILAENGHEVVITGRDSGQLVKAVRETGAKGFVEADLLEEGAAFRLYNEARQTLGHIDVLINNAGLYIWAGIEKTDPNDIKKLLQLNLDIPIELCGLVVPEMKSRKWGRIINMGSISGAVGEANASLYSASKAGLIGLSKALALELAEYGITVNTINPGWVKTGLSQEVIAEGSCEEQENLDMIPQKRWIEPEEIAELVKYLISDPAHGITGQSLNLCCGLSLG